jgi:hypothetical protein
MGGSCYLSVWNKKKTIPVTGREGPYGCETSRIPRFIHYYYYLLFFGLWGYWHWGHSWPIVPASGDIEDDFGEADGM